MKNPKLMSNEELFATAFETGRDFIFLRDELITMIPDNGRYVAYRKELCAETAKICYGRFRDLLDEIKARNLEAEYGAYKVERIEKR